MGTENFLSVLFSACYFILAGYALTIQISPGGKDEPACKEGSVPCASLDYVFDGGKGVGSNVLILIEPGNYVLSNNTQFENMQNISIVGNKVNGAVHNISCSMPNVGLSFTRCTNIRIKGLYFEHCGRKQDVSTENIENITSTLTFVFSKGIEVLYSEFAENRGSGIAIIDTGGHVKLEQVFVSHNLINGYGSGVVIATTHCGALDTVNCTFQHEQQEYIHNGIYELIFVRLNGSLNDKQDDVLFDEISSAPKLGQGGGLTIHLCGNASGNTMFLSWCSFYNNKAKWGGGMYIGISNTTQNNKISVSHTTFYSNKAVYGGGAVQVTLRHTKHVKSSKENRVSFSKGYFGFNSAVWGGAISIKGSTRILEDGNIDKLDSQFSLRSVTFKSNLATVGSAIAVATINFNYNPIGPGVSYSLLLQDCAFFKNKIILTEDKKVVGQGSVYAEEFILLMNSTKFINNDGTALVLDSSTFNVLGNVTFEGNTGERGGAVALYGGSWFHLNAKSFLLFIKNNATIKGGAIYFQYSGAQRLGFQTTKLSTKECFFRYENQVLLDPTEWDCKVIFIDNMAPDASGNSIFASSLQTCRTTDEALMNNNALEWRDVFQYISTFNQSYPEIATSTVNITADPKNWNVHPSVPFSPKVSLIDEKGNSVFGTIKVNLSPNVASGHSNVSLDPPNNIFLIKDEIHDMKVIGKENSDFSVNLMTTDGQLSKTNTVKVHIKNCPPGYHQDKDSKVCSCMEELKAITRCGDNFTAYLLIGYWGHRNKHGVFEAFKCPRNYCNCSKKVGRIHHYECPFNKITCTENRQGVLCGNCSYGYSVLLGTEKCEICSNYYLFLLIPILIVSSVFVLVVFYFNFDAFSGYLNAFLYSYQSVDTVLPEVVSLDPFIGVVIGVLCLSGTGNTIGVCLWDGLTDLQKLGFNLGVPLYILLFTVLVGTCWSRNLLPRSSGNAIRSNSFGRALSFVYTYSYTALTSKALILLNPIKINERWMVYSAPNAQYFGKDHIGYAIGAILILIVFTLGFPIVLLFTPYFTKHFSSIARMEPAFNVLKLCFKNPINSKSDSNYGPFAAFYFVCRLIVLLFDVFVKDETPRLVLIAISSVLFLVIFCWFQPYVIWTMNFWDVLLLTNMCVISIVSVIVSVPYMLTDAYITALELLLKILVYLPLAVILVRFIAYRKTTCSRKRKMKQCMEGNINRYIYIYIYNNNNNNNKYKCLTRCGTSEKYIFCCQRATC